MQTAGLNRRYVTLDGLRGVAALFVVARHFGDLRGAPHGQFSYLAVDIFFLLSGFVLSFRYRAALAGDMTAAQFMRRRVLRLYPLYALGAVLGLFAWLSGLQGPIAARTVLVVIAAALAMLPAPTWRWGVPSLFPVLLPAWSLFFELYVANLLFALGRRHWTPSSLAAVTVFSGTALLIAVGRHGSLDLGATWPTFAAGVARVCFSFFAGVLLERLHTHKPATRSVPSWLILALLAALLAPSIAGSMGQVYECICVFVLFPALVFFGASAFERRPALGKALGDMSYAAYAIHYPLVHLTGVALAAAGIFPGLGSGLDQHQ